MAESKSKTATAPRSRKGAEMYPGKSAGKSPEKSAGKSPEKSAGKSAGKSTEKSAEKSSGKSAGKKPTENVSHRRKLQYMSVDDLVPTTDNPRVGDMKRIKASIKRHGFLSPVVVNTGTNRVLVGNHRLRAAKDLGIKEIPVLMAELTPENADEFMLADNKASDEAGYDEIVLAGLLNHVPPENLAGTGYTRKEVTAIVARAEWQSDEDFEMLAEDRDEDKTRVADMYKDHRPDERTEVLESLARRSMILSIPLKKHETLVKGMKRARKDLNVDTNEELLVALLKAQGFLKSKFVLFESDVPDDREDDEESADTAGA